MGIGRANGERRAEEAARLAINSPLLDISIDGATGVLFSVSGGEDLSMFEVQEAARVITAATDPNAKIIFGAVVDPTMKKGDIRVTVIATGFPKGDRGPLISPEKTMDFNIRENAPGRIYNSIIPPDTRISKDNYAQSLVDEDDQYLPPAPKQQVKKETPPEEESFDDDWALPSFLRRKK
jgi:cell division protein FtsZ